jgi:iron(III) transport system ATP-binding protein
MTADVTISNVHKAFGRTEVLRGVDLTIAAGCTTAIVGPSGSGKTTLLRVIAGFESPDEGRVAIGGVEVCGPRRWVPPHRRGIGYVAQDGALFPHLTVEQNIAFGLDGPTAHKRHRVRELLELMNLEPGYLTRRPHELSGGQQQRVSVARALAPGPGMVLLDEPFSALDAGLRTATRAAVARALAEFDVTAMLVTHDHAEALSFADEVGVIIGGSLRQVGPPQAIYRSPVDVATARLVGDVTTLPATVADGTASCDLGVLPVEPTAPVGPATLLLRPEQIRITRATDASNEVHAFIRAVEYMGPDSLVRLRTSNGHVLLSRSAEIQPRDRGARVAVHVVGPVRAVPAAEQPATTTEQPP